jgi:hypothetical protein
VIDARLRGAVLAAFPLGTPFLIVAPEQADYAAIARERGDGAADIRPLEAVAATDGMLHASVPHVLLEGLDELDDPREFLDRLRARVPAARLFALVANAAHLPALSAFFAGGSPARGHPLVRDEIAPLLRAAGWEPLTIDPLADDSLPPAQAAPLIVRGSNIDFRIADAAALERGRCAAFFVVADRR